LEEKQERGGEFSFNWVCHSVNTDFNPTLSLKFSCFRTTHFLKQERSIPIYATTYHFQAVLTIMPEVQ
jgi:hypothetical protein